MTDVILNSNSYNENSFENNGHRTQFIQALKDFLIEADNKIALTGLLLTATSTTSLTLSETAKSATIEANKGFSVGSRVRFASIATPATHYMDGVVTSYNQSSGLIEVSIDLVVGTGTLNNWSVSITGNEGQQGTLSGVASNDINLNGYNLIQNNINLNEDIHSYRLVYPIDGEYVLSYSIPSIYAGAMIETATLLQAGSTTITPKINDVAISGGDHSNSSIITRSGTLNAGDKLSIGISGASNDASELEFSLRYRRGI